MTLNPDRLNPGLYWLSFVDTDQIDRDDPNRVPGGNGFLGVCIIEATGPIHAVERAWDLGINPGGEVGIMGPIPVEIYGPELRDRLLSADEAKEL